MGHGRSTGRVCWEEKDRGMIQFYLKLKYILKIKINNAIARRWRVMIQDNIMGMPRPLKSQVNCSFVYLQKASTWLEQSLFVGGVHEVPQLTEGLSQNSGYWGKVSFILMMQPIMLPIFRQTPSHWCSCSLFLN